jgi:chemotaxis receptor (MCP) glutamine deamidase CheD
MLLLASLARNSAAKLRLTGTKRPASWHLMACATIGRGVVIAEVDKDSRLGRLVHRLLPSCRHRSSLHRRRRFGLLSMPSPVCLPGGVAGIARRLFFDLPGGLPFGRH